MNTIAIPQIADECENVDRTNEGHSPFADTGGPEVTG